MLSVLLLLLRLTESNENAVEVGEGSVFESREWDGTVSYTHLTLPTT